MNLNPETNKSSFLYPGHIQLLNEQIQALVARDLQAQGYRGIIAEMPPRHGKSELVSHYTPPWYLGLFPEHSVALASYESEFAASWGGKARSVLEQWGPQIFGVQVDRRSSASNRWQVQRTKGKQFEPGLMVTAGIGGPLTGRGANLLIIDDPVKNMVEAHSKARRQAIWDWFVSTAFPRLEPDGIVIIIMTRWHDDDLVGRLLKAQDESGERYLELSLPAIAGEDDLLGRVPGAPLWADRFDVPELEKRQKSLGTYVWNALYQQCPVSREGGYFDFDHLPIIEDVSKLGRVVRLSRRWDLAATEGAGDFTAGVLMGRTNTNKYVILDVVRGQFSPHRTQQIIKATAAKDGRNCRIRMEQERGAAGKSLIAIYKRLLNGYAFKGIWTTGDKELRAMPLSACAERGDLYLLRGNWNTEFVSEAVVYPHGANDDQVDAASGAYEDVSGKGGLVVL